MTTTTTPIAYNHAVSAPITRRQSWWFRASAALDTHSYGYFGALGFTCPYTRTHWANV